MKSLFNILSILVCLLLLSRCNITDTDDLDGGNFTYPLRVGNMWQYEGQLITFNYRILINGDPVPEGYSDTLSFSSTVRITGRETIPNALQAFVLEETFTDSSQQNTTYNYYNNTNRGLTFFGYRNAIGFPHIPKPADKRSRSPLSAWITSLPDISSILSVLSIIEHADDELVLEDPPPVSILKNLEEGTQWTYRTAGSPWRIDKKVVGIESVELPSGTFECYKVQWLIDLNDDGRWNDNIIFFDYIGDQGLLVRDLTTLDILHYDPDDMEHTGYFDGRLYSIATNFTVGR
jgi:hypothetical protein